MTIKRQNQRYEPGKGDAWAKKWEADKVNLYPNAFQAKYTKWGKKRPVQPLLKMAIILTLPNYIEPGYFIGIDKTPAIINVEFPPIDKSGAVLLNI